MDEKSQCPTHHPSENLEFATVPTHINSEYSQFIEPASIPLAYRSSTHTTLSSTADPALFRGPSVENYNSLSPRTSRSNSLVEEARAAACKERRMTIAEALLTYRKAIAWSALLSLTIVMEGFDISLITAFFALPAFKQDFGSRTRDGFQISPSWQAGLTNGALAGEILGLLLSGYLADKFGNRRTMILSLFSLAIFIFLSFFAVSLSMLLVAQVLTGIPLGIFQTLSTTYAAECMPMVLRAYLTSSINLCWLIGQLIAVGTLRCLIHNPSSWSYRIPFALQWVWIVPILIGVTFAPESPWWLIKHERPEEAKRALSRLTSRNRHPGALLITAPSVSNPRRNGAELKIDYIVALMIYTDLAEKCSATCPSYISCFRSPNLRRTEIASFVWMTQSVCGIMTGYSTYFFYQADLATEHAFTLSVAMYGAGILGVGLCWILMHYCGRRTLYLWGSGAIAMILLASGILGAVHPNAPSTAWALGSLTILVTFVYDSTIGPVCYALVSEIPCSRLRVKTLVLARTAYNVLSILTNVLMPYLVHPDQWNWKGKTCLLWAGATAGFWVWCYWRLPEPKGLTFWELNVLFEKGAKARKFSEVRGLLGERGYFD